MNPNTLTDTPTTAFGPLVSVQWLQQRLAAKPEPSQLVVMDCSFDLAQPEAGLASYQTGHIAGALHAHLDRDLSAAKSALAEGEPVPSASGGRHPLPTRENFARTLARWGIQPSSQVVVYDRNANMFGGRLWWMLKWCGHEQVAVLDGGWQAWQAIGGAVQAGDTQADAGATRQSTALGGTVAAYPLQAPLVPLRTVTEVAQHLGDNTQTVVDARAFARYTGEIELLDPRAGHIPGALNRPFAHNFDANGLYKSPAQLRQEWAQVLGQHDPATVVMHCGSGVTAVPNIIAMQLAGYPTPALFAGSWSEWCSDPMRPVAMGALPV
jgi:thiosulfate/3-mercaptopyruvate sulfurtransferase